MKTAIHITAGDPVSRVSHLDVDAMIARVNRDAYGFMTAAEVAILAAHPEGRLVRVLVRCGSCRFVCAAQDVMHLIGAVESIGDYVRDCSIPAGI